jgi:hypothetical protein
MRHVSAALIAGLAILAPGDSEATVYRCKGDGKPSYLNVSPRSGSANKVPRMSTANAELIDSLKETKWFWSDLCGAAGEHCKLDSKGTLRYSRTFDESRVTVVLRADGLKTTENKTPAYHERVVQKCIAVSPADAIRIGDQW